MCGIGISCRKRFNFAECKTPDRGVQRMQRLSQHRLSSNATQERKTIRARPEKRTKILMPKGVMSTPTVRLNVRLIPRDSRHNRVPSSLPMRVLVIICFSLARAKHCGIFTGDESDLRTKEASHVSVDSSRQGACHNTGQVE